MQSTPDGMGLTENNSTSEMRKANTDLLIHYSLSRIFTSFPGNDRLEGALWVRSFSFLR